MIHEQEIQRYLNKSLPIKIFDVTDSTNADGRRIAESVGFYETLIIAKRQTAGKGRMGRSFFSDGCGLYMSLLLKPDSSTEVATHITTAAAVAITRAIKAVTGIETKIKWVNDIFLNGKKICGILTEAKALPSGRLDYAILGIGINLIMPTGGFPTEISQIAGALFEEIPENADNRLAAEIFNEFYRLYDRGLNPRDYIEEYRNRSCIMGKEVTVTKVLDGEKKVGIASHIDDEFRLWIQYPDGSREILSTGEITMHS